jgi:predicted glutamine amidotransferase
MCIIAIKPAGTTMPDEGKIRTMWQGNSDGAGLMYARNGKVHIEKGFMKLKQLSHRIDHLRRKADLDNCTVVLHFRIGTAGGKIPQNTHPFPVSPMLEELNKLEIDCPLGVAHNGIIPIDPRNKTISDTMEYILTQLAVLQKAMPDFYENEWAMKLIENATHSKMAFLKGDGNFYTIGRFQTEDGILYSNGGYIPWSGSRWQGVFGHWDKTTGAYTYYDEEDYMGKEPWEKQLCKGKASEDAPELYLTWLNPELEYIVLPDGTLGNADDWLIDENNSLYVYDLESDGCYLVPGARRVPLDTRLTDYSYALSEPLPIVSATA